MPERSRRETLSDDEVAALSRAGKWLATTAAKDGLGDTFKTALRRSEQVPLAEATIGRSGGLDPAITEAQPPADLNLGDICVLLCGSLFPPAVGDLAQKIPKIAEWPSHNQKILGSIRADRVPEAGRPKGQTLDSKPN